MDATENSADQSNIPSDTQGNKNSNSVQKKVLKDLIAVRANYGPNEPRRILKNLLVLGLAFVLLFTAFLSMANLQSSINKKGGLGSYSLATVYMTLLISSLFIPSIIIHKIGCKQTLIFSMSGYAVYIAVQFYPTFATLIPAGVLLGICASPLWAAQSIYLTKISEEYAFLTGQTTEVILQRFFGTFFLCLQSAHVWGNLMAATLLISNKNETLRTQETPARQCGIDFLPDSMVNKNISAILSTSDEPDATKLYTLATIFLVCSVLAAIVVIFLLDSLDRFGESIVKANANKPKLYDRAVATVRHWKNPYQLLLIPITMWFGFEQGFIGTDFTAGYVSCALGIHYIGYVFICYGICNSLSSYIFGQLTEYVGRPAVFIWAHILYFTAASIMMTWQPTSADPIMFFIVAGLWGLGDGVLTAQLYALNGLIFPNTLDAAFSNNRLWNALGYLIAYINGNKLSMRTKLYICLVTIIVSVVTYLCVEIGVRRQKKRAAETREDATDKKTKI